MTLVATVLVMILALVFGVWMARDRKVDFGIRPLLDAGQTIPPFVYLIPVLALFGPSRFTAIVAGIVYAAPAAIKLVADGVKGVSPTTIEAGRSTGSDDLAGDHQGPAADGQGLAGAGHQPGPALRAVHDGHRRPRRRGRPRLRRRLRLLPQRGVGQGRGRRPHHRAARRDARPDHPRGGRRTPRRRSGRAGPSTRGCRSASPATGRSSTT